MSELSDKLAQESANPQFSRMKSLQRKTKQKTRARGTKRKTPEKKVVHSEKDETVKPSEAAVAFSPPDDEHISEISEVYFTNKSFVWHDSGENELENRLEKLNKILSEIKEEKVQKIKDSVAKWQSKYEKHLLDLEQAVLSFQRKCKYEKADLNEQINRVEEMSDINVAVRHRIEKKLSAYGHRMESGQTQTLFSMFLNMLRGLLYCMAQIRDAFMGTGNDALKAKDSSQLETRETDEKTSLKNDKEERAEVRMDEKKTKAGVAS
ncbi:unnamed protein product [Cylicocyclus nassatus]|uniref:Uncharacterized protein n=1 Tax=Cylicocyclus nassatus TaxID=53992 RepID=A0AA36M9M2_CYLNA|nr:unnamed protein product [Cylicocyclus nassatus]